MSLQGCHFCGPAIEHTLRRNERGNDTTGNGTAYHPLRKSTPRRRPSPLREVQQPETSGYFAIFMPGVYSQNIALVPFVNLSALYSDQQHELRGGPPFINLGPTFHSLLVLPDSTAKFAGFSNFQFVETISLTS